MRILLVEDDRMVGASLCQALSRSGFVTDWARTGETAAEALAVNSHELILLDLGLPPPSGLELLAGLREGDDRRPVIIITARDNVEDRIAGLDLGADDYVLKPFAVEELVARIRAVTRRHAGQASSRLVAGEVTLDLATNAVTFRGHTEVLSAREFGVLRALAQRPGTILSRAQLEEKLYGWDNEVGSNAVDVLIHYVRSRFGKDIIVNVRGAGWLVPGSRP